MKVAEKTSLSSVLEKYEPQILADWLGAQAKSARGDRANQGEVRRLCQDFLAAVKAAAASEEPFDTASDAWAPVRDILTDVSSTRATQGYSPAETATFVFSLKQPVFAYLRKDLESRPQSLADALWEATLAIDGMALFTTEMYQKSREEVIERQQRELLELSTPVVELWEGVLALPLIGTLDSARTQVVMESLLEKIVSSGSAIAIIDITGVPTVDTLVAQHLMKTVAAARLMGADCIISGIRPQIAQTIVHLGVDLQQVVTKASLADALQVALKKTGARIERASTAG